MSYNDKLLNYFESSDLDYHKMQDELKRRSQNLVNKNIFRINRRYGNKSDACFIDDLSPIYLYARDGHSYNLSALCMMLKPKEKDILNIAEECLKAIVKAPYHSYRFKKEDIKISEILSSNYDNYSDGLWFHNKNNYYMMSDNRWSNGTNYGIFDFKNRR